MRDTLFEDVYTYSNLLINISEIQLNFMFYDLSENEEIYLYYYRSLKIKSTYDFTFPMQQKNCNCYKGEMKKTEKG